MIVIRFPVVGSVTVQVCEGECEKKERDKAEAKAELRKLAEKLRTVKPERMTGSWWGE